MSCMVDLHSQGLTRLTRTEQAGPSVPDLTDKEAEIREVTHIKSHGYSCNMYPFIRVWC